MQAVEHALMAATAENRVCYFCNQQGHIASNCPKKRQQRIPHHPPGRHSSQNHSGYPPKMQGYPQHPGGARQFTSPQNGGRNVVPNRPQFQAPPAVTPVHPSTQYTHHRNGPGINPPQTNISGHYSQSLMFPGYYNLPTHSQYPQPPMQFMPAGYYSAPMMQTATTPYHTPMPSGTAYNNPAFEASQF